MGKNELKIDGLHIFWYPMLAIESNMYIILKGDCALIIDPNVNDDALSLLKANNIKAVVVLLTHEHFDHISGVNWLREHFETQVLCSKTCADIITDPGRNLAKFWRVLIMDKPEDVQLEGLKLENPEYSCSADITFEKEYKLEWEGHVLRFCEAPGHSKGGSLIFLDEWGLFSGDNLVEGAGVICRLPGGNKKEYDKVTRPLIEGLSDDLFVFPGHGKPSSLSNLRQYQGLFDRTAMKEARK